MKKVERVYLNLSNEIYNKINHCEDLNEIITGTLSNGGYSYEVVIFSDNTIDYYEIKIKTDKGVISSKGDFKSLMFKTFDCITYEDNQVIFRFDFDEPKIPKTTSISISELKTNMILEGKISLDYLKAIAINHSFEDEEELGEVLFIYLYLKMNLDLSIEFALKENEFGMRDVEEYMIEKFKYYGYTYETLQKHYKTFSNEYLKRIVEIAIPMLYLNEFEEVDTDELRKIYNEFQKIEITKKY